MRSAIYRRPDLLRLSIPRKYALHRLTYSTSGAPLESHPPSQSRPQYPLYRPETQPLYEPERTPYRQQEVDPRSLPSDRRMRKSSKIQLTQKAIQDLPEFQEDELRNFYAAVMESGRDDGSSQADVPLIEGPSRAPNERTKRLTSGQRRQVLEGLEGRFLGPSPSNQAGPSRLGVRSIREGGARVYEILERLRAVQVPAEGRISLGLVSRTEWSVLLDEVSRLGNGRDAEALLDLMSIHGVIPDDKQITQVMEVYTKAGRVTDVARIHDLIGQSGLEVQDSQQDLLIQAHLNHSPPLILPAIDMISSLATAGTPLPQSSYDILLRHLTAPQSSSASRALAWDLFANMRLTAHPTPTPLVFSTMISACSNSRDPQPERARDLWLELIDTRTPTGTAVQPGRLEYDAIIRALSSTKSTYLEAFDLFRQMLAKHTEATFVPFDDSDTEKWSRFVPTAETFTALLEGTKRAGDLNRARWVLNEVVRLQASGLGDDWKGVDEELMSGVFMTYASWKPVVRRQLVKGNRDGQVSEIGQAKEQGTASSAIDARETILVEDTRKGSYGSQLASPNPDAQDIDVPSDPSHAAPLTAADAIREADALFQQILHDTDTTSTHPSEEETTPASGPFTNVRLSARLLNSYLSVHLAHAPSIAAARQAWEDSWSLVAVRGVRMNGWSMMQVLERCAAGEQGKDREGCTEWGKAIWGEYTSFAKSAGLDLTSTSNTQSSSTEVKQYAPDTGSPQYQNPYLLGLGPRQIERSYRSMIRILALSPLTPATESTSLLSSFYTLFPPSSILATYTPAPSPSTRFQIRMTDPGSTPESNIPPHLLWSDVDVLHQRLVREGKKTEVGWLKWVCKSYEVALRKRRRWRLKGKGGEVAKGRKGSRSGSALDSGSRGAIGDASEGEEEADGW